MSKLSTLGKRDKRRILRAHRGILARIASVVGVSPQAVQLVWWGQSTSGRIKAAIEAELAKLPDPEPELQQK